MPVACFFIATPWGDDGVSNHFRIVAQTLIARGHQVVILTDQRSIPDGLADDHLTVCTWPSPRPTHLRDFLFLYWLIRRYRPDGLIANFGAGNVMMLMGWLMRVPLRVIWYRTILAAILTASEAPTWKNRLLIARKKGIYRLATWVVANCAAGQVDVEQAFAVPRRKTTYFYNLMDDPVRTLLRTLTEYAKRTGVVCVGRLDANKGQDIVIRALALLAPEFPALTVDFIGHGPQLEALASLARELGVLDRCRFSGRVSHAEVFARMNESWFTLALSRHEAFGRVVAESLAVGVPVIASNVGGIPEVIRDGVDGWLVPSDDPAALAERMAQMLRDPDLRRTMGHNARQRFLSTFEQSVGRDRLVTWLETEAAALL